MLALAFVVFAILVLFGRLIGHGLARIDGWVGRFIPRWAASLVTAALFVAAVVVISDDVVFRRFVDWANERYAASDVITPQEAARPQSALVSGGPGSRAPWDTLGEYGKGFVSDATTPRELRRFAGPQSDVTDPDPRVRRSEIGGNSRRPCGARGSGARSNRAASRSRRRDRLDVDGNGVGRPGRCEGGRVRVRRRHGDRVDAVLVPPELDFLRSSSTDRRPPRRARR